MVAIKFSYRFYHNDKNEKKFVAQKLFSFFLSAFASTFEKITHRSKERKDTSKGNEIKEIDINERTKTRNMKMKNEVIFIALHNDNRFENDFFLKAFFHFFYKFCEKYISIFKSQLPIIAKS